MLKKEVLELCLLQMLLKEDQYGYELLKRLHSAFPDTQESAIYALLRGLCREGRTESYQGRQSGGPARKYYRLTPAGQEYQKQLLAQWQSLQRAMEELGIL